jgi:hypothetical protein
MIKTFKVTKGTKQSVSQFVSSQKIDCCVFRNIQTGDSPIKIRGIKFASFFADLCTEEELPIKKARVGRKKKIERKKNVSMKRFKY